MISWIKDKVTLREELNSKSATAEGSHSQRPPIHTGRANKPLSKSLTHLSVTAGINSLTMVNSREQRRSDIIR